MTLGMKLCRLLRTTCLSHHVIQCSRRFYTSSAQTPPSLSTLFPNLQEQWVPPKTQPTKRDLIKNSIPSTRYWTQKELEFFRLHYFQVTDPAHLNTVFCEQVPLTAEASDISQLKLTTAEIIEGRYGHLPWHMREFAENLFSAIVTTRTEATSDHLILFLLRLCNPDESVIVPEPQLESMKTQVGKNENSCTFVSIPDVTVNVRQAKRPFVGATLVVAENKKNTTTNVNVDGVAVVEDRRPDPGNSGEFQLPGEMVSAAMRNYVSNQFPQTIFGLRVIGTQVTFYRADFPVHYLASIANGVPADDITIFRFGGQYNTKDLGLAVDDREDRRIVIQWICNYMGVCRQLGLHLTNNTVSPITRERIADLYKLV
jgi:hypothetical protein